MPRKNNVANELAVIIPYRDLENLLNIAKTVEDIEKHCKRMEKRCAMMQLQYIELMEKIEEINKYL